MPLFNFQDPDEVGSSEYRAIYECLQDVLDDFAPEEWECTREDHAESMLGEIIDSALAMLNKLSRQPETTMLNQTETATILAALRYYQHHGQGDPANRSLDIHEIATAGDELTSLNDEGIDELCEKLNFAETDRQ